LLVRHSFYLLLAAFFAFCLIASEFAVRRTMRDDLSMWVLLALVCIFLSLGFAARFRHR
jgi:hypothetical protein